MVISIETTLPHPRRGFIKLEDTVAVTDDGWEASAIAGGDGTAAASAPHSAEFCEVFGAIHLTIEPVTLEAFAPFGELLAPRAHRFARGRFPAPQALDKIACGAAPSHRIHRAASAGAQTSSRANRRWIAQ